MPPIVGRAARAASAAYKKADVGNFIRGPVGPQPVYSALPGSWSPTITVRGFLTVEWAVFQVSESGAYTSDMTPLAVSAPAGTAANGTWSFTPSATIKGARDRVIVKTTFSWPAPAGTLEWQSEGAVVNLPPPAAGTGAAPGTGLAHARDFMSDLTVGVNIERAATVLTGWITTGRLQSYKDAGCTHVRFFVPATPNDGLDFGISPKIPQVDNGDLDWFFDAVGRAIGVGLKVQFDLLDVVFEGSQADKNEMWDDRIMPYLTRCGKRIAARNWDVRKYAVGAANEYGGGNNGLHKTRMHQAVATLRAELPNSLLVCAAALWNDPGSILGDVSSWAGPMGTFEPPADTRLLVQWHKYDDNAHNADGANYWQGRLNTWAADNNRVTFCGEWGRGPADGGGGVVGDQGYLQWANVIGFSVGMWQQAPTYWTVTSSGWWRMNKDNTGELRDEVVTALKAADAAIRAKPEWQSRKTAWTAGAAPAGGNAAPAGSAVVPRIQVLHRGQSNAYFGDSSGAAEMLRATFQNLAGVPVDMVSRRETADDSTLHSGTHTYWDSPYNNEGRWLAPPSNNYASDPATWTAQDPMVGTLNAVSRNVSTDSAVPLYDFPVHNEYDGRMDDGAARAAYPNGYWEPARRIRAARTKAAGKHVHLRGYCPYTSDVKDATLDVIRRAWLADFGDASRNVLKACGNMHDAVDRADFPGHWTDATCQRLYPRVAFMAAVHAYKRGWLPSTVDLSDCPSEGPWITGASVSGNSVTLTVAHDKGTALVGGADGVDWAAFTCSAADNYDAHMDANNGQIMSATSIRVDFPSPPPANGFVWHAAKQWYRNRGIIRDNWHAIRPAKYAAVPNVAQVEFPLQRTFAPIPLGAAGGGGGTVERSFDLNPDTPGTRAAGIWNTTLTVAGMPRVAWAVQNGEAQGYSFASGPFTVDVPANGQVAIAANFTASGQFLLFYDPADDSFRGFTAPVTIA